MEGGLTPRDLSGTEHPVGAVLREVNRRRVGRVAVAYLAAAYGILECAWAFLPGLGSPAWAFRAVLGAVALGFPLATVLAWDFDITPRGIERTSDESGPAVEALPLWRWVLFLAFWIGLGLGVRFFT